jgi:hypothetical protein
VIRHCQTLRKESGFAVEQRVTLTLRTENAPLRTIFEDARAHIMEEVLAKDLRISEGKQTSDPSANPAQTTVRVAESDVHITLRGLQI